MAKSTAASTFKKIRTHQRAKFEMFNKQQLCSLTSTKQGLSIDTSKWIVNLPDHTLTQDEKKALRRGPNFAPTPTCIRKIDIISGIEPTVESHPDQAGANRARAAINNILRRAKPPRPNITRAERTAINQLRANKDIVIIKADKGNAIVVMNATDYEFKATTLLNASPFRRPLKDQTKNNEKELNGAF